MHVHLLRGGLERTDKNVDASRLVKETIYRCRCEGEGDREICESCLFVIQEESRLIIVRTVHRFPFFFLSSLHPLFMRSFLSLDFYGHHLPP